METGDIQKNNYPSNCNRSLFIYFFQFDFGCTTYFIGTVPRYLKKFQVGAVPEVLTKNFHSMSDLLPTTST
jgi:hypothetical protein